MNSLFEEFLKENIRKIVK